MEIEPVDRPQTIAEWLDLLKLLLEQMDQIKISKWLDSLENPSKFPSISEWLDNL